MTKSQLDELCSDINLVLGNERLSLAQQQDQVWDQAAEPAACCRTLLHMHRRLHTRRHVHSNVIQPGNVPEGKIYHI